MESSWQQEVELARRISDEMHQILVALIDDTGVHDPLARIEAQRIEVGKRVSRLIATNFELGEFIDRNFDDFKQIMAPGFRAFGRECLFAHHGLLRTCADFTAVLFREGGRALKSLNLAFKNDIQPPTDVHPVSIQKRPHSAVEIAWGTLKTSVTRLIVDKTAGTPKAWVTASQNDIEAEIMQLERLWIRKEREALATSTAPAELLASLKVKAAARVRGVLGDDRATLTYREIKALRNHDFENYIVATVEKAVEGGCLMTREAAAESLFGLKSGKRPNTWKNLHDRVRKRRSSPDTREE